MAHLKKTSNKPRNCVVNNNIFEFYRSMQRKGFFVYAYIYMQIKDTFATQRFLTYWNYEQNGIKFAVRD